MEISLLDAGILAGTGYGVVFAGLIVLMLVITLMGKVFSAKKKEKTSEKVESTAEVTPIAQEPAAPAAPGSAGTLKLYDTPPKTAAILMAIVADKMGKPLNELRFISIKEVK